MTQSELKEKIDKLERGLKSEATPEFAKKQMQITLDDLKSKLKEEKPKEEKKEKVSKEPKKEKSEKEKQETKETKAEPKKDAYDCDELVKEAKERHAKAKAAAEARANAPKKSEATKDKEKIEKVHETVEKHIEKGKFTKPQLEKLIQETKDLLKLLEKALKDL